MSLVRHVATIPLATLLLAGYTTGHALVDTNRPWSPSHAAAEHAYVEAESRALVAEQVAAFPGCWAGTRPGYVPPTVLVRNAVGFDKGVVRRVSFAAAWEAASGGRVWVVGQCAT